MNESPVINKDIVADHSIDFIALKEQGVKKLQTLSGNNWTDYNLHDPGITILETLCYSLADLSYRAGFDINDILYSSAKFKLENSLYPPHEILTTSPLSPIDFKGLILDIEGIKNCEIIPSSNNNVIPGSFDIKLEIHPEFDEKDTKRGIKEIVFEILNSNRPIGIIFDKIEFLKFDLIGLNIDIELTEEIDAKKIFSSILREIHNYLSPELKFNSLDELIDKKIPMDTIFSGPLLKNGFLLDQDINDHFLRKQIYASDIISLLMKLNGVSYVKDLKIIGSDNNDYNWIYKVSKGKVPRIDPSKTKFICRYKNMIVFESSAKSIELLNHTKLNYHSSHTRNRLKKNIGVEKNLSKYYSIQNDFPAAYGIGDKGPAAGSNSNKLAAIKQLKGYLLIYDQIMANFLSQLNHVKYLFSTEDIESSYAVQLIDDIPGVEFLYKQFVENYYINYNNFEDKINIRREWINFLETNREKLKNEIHESFETKEEFFKRRNKVLDHLLARFGIDTLNLEVLSEMESKEAIKYKLDLLRNFPKLAYEKYSMGESSLIENETGLMIWLKKNANIRGIGHQKISVINQKISKSNSEHNLELEIYSTKNPINKLLKFGSEIENYVVSANNEVSILDNTNEVISRIIFLDNKENDLLKAAFEKIKELDVNSENFLLIDHITLKPKDDLNCFGFDVLFNQKTFFSSERNFSLKQCKKFSKEFSKLCKQKENYSVIETSMKEFRIEFLCNFGKLLTREYYSSFKEASDYLNLFLCSNVINKEQFSFYTKFENSYINISNPFSYIVSIILPTWPSKFQKVGFKKYLEDYFIQELPAHIVVNIKWFDFDKMKDFENDWDNYKSSLNSNDSEFRLISLEKILAALIT